jgi:hypothetical protein
MTPEQVHIYRQMPPARKIELAIEFNRSARALKAAALRSQYPHWSKEDIHRKVREIFLYAAS